MKKRGRIKRIANKLDNECGDPQQAWRIINNILGRNDQQLDTISKFKLENHIVSSLQYIANKFNEQFTYIGPTLAERINYPNDNHLSSLSFSKVTAIDKISAKVLSRLIDFLAPVFEKPINLSSDQQIIHDKISYSPITNRGLKSCS